ncbi:MAG: hypothetical protein DRP65_03290 [Planctomycetota bacterium]|nr:MAG: hypothetical protein DRP65_03290 [Planctomycetota bacterium]
MDFHKLTLHLFKLAFLGFFAATLMCLSGPCYANDNDVQNADESPEFTRIGDIKSGNMGGEVHIINLYDHQDFITWPGGEPQNPFSLRITCGKCHDYETISRGWHFNAGFESVLDPESGQKVPVKIDPGRVSEPWIYWDCQTATQIPLSYRPWPGTYRPEQLGVSKWWFTRIFGRHLPGGGVSVRDETADLDPKDRWAVSGDLEINCLTCHSASPSYNQSEFANQIAKQNFRWAATAASGLATVTGSVKALPGLWLPTDGSKDVPNVVYHKSRFLPEQKTFIDIQKKISNKRCLYCHSTKNIGAHTDEDVHLSAGLSCVDCHRNGLDHVITRGYEGEPNQPGHVASCKGCHLPAESSPVPVSGRLGAPEPAHPGIPTVHFDKLTCTACHSGPWPGKTTIRAKTSRAHALGTQNVNISDETLPHIFSPVFIPDQTGKIGPHKIIWPSFWAHLKGRQVVPIAPQIVKEAAGNILYHKLELESATWPKLTDQMVTQVLGILASENSRQGRPVYICGGKLYCLDDSGKLTEQEHPAAGPYAWPIAHDVRPAAQSLGVRGCADCHATDAPFFFGAVEVDSPLASQQGRVKIMADFEGIDAVYTKAFAFAFVFRPWLKLITIACSAVVAAVLLLYALKALACLTKVFARQDNKFD